MKQQIIDKLTLKTRNMMYSCSHMDFISYLLNFIDTYTLGLTIAPFKLIKLLDFRRISVKVVSIVSIGIPFLTSDLPVVVEHL